MAGLQSIVTLTAGAVLMAATRLGARARLYAAGGALALVLSAAFALPFAGERYERRMGDLGTYTHSRDVFIAYSAHEAIRFEAHLSHLIIAGLDSWLGATARSPGHHSARTAGPRLDPPESVPDDTPDAVATPVPVRPSRRRS